MVHRMIAPLTAGLYRRSDAIVTYGNHVRDYLVKQGVPGGKVFVAPHAVDNELCGRPITAEVKSIVRRKLGLQEGDRVIVYVGRLESSKGLTYLLRAFASLECMDAKLLIVGSGRQAVSLQALAGQMSRARKIQFVGTMEPEQITNVLGLAEVLVLPSVATSAGSEPWGLVVNEAFNQGVPVIVSNAVGAAAGGLVRDGYNGFIVAERNSEVLTSRLDRLLREPGLREDLGAEARSSIKDWDNELMVSGFRQAIAYVTEKSTGTARLHQPTGSRYNAS
jgi:glycosyltransferase involved in cell wall biosynthesis